MAKEMVPLTPTLPSPWKGEGNRASRVLLSRVDGPTYISDINTTLCGGGWWLRGCGRGGG